MGLPMVFTKTDLEATLFVRLLSGEVVENYAVVPDENNKRLAEEMIRIRSRNSRDGVPVLIEGSESKETVVGRDPITIEVVG